MEADLYEQFILLKDSGEKVKAKDTLDLFIASFKTLEQKRAWVLPFLEQGKHGHKIRHEIYEHLIYPVLIDGYLKKDVSSIVWLAKTFNNLYSLKSLHPSLRCKTDFALLKEAYRVKPNEHVRADLLRKLIDGFSFSQHEWPAGILYGMNGADIKQCEEILQEIEFARSLDSQRNYENYLSEFEAKVHQYIKRLQ